MPPRRDGQDSVAAARLHVPLGFGSVRGASQLPRWSPTGEPALLRRLRPLCEEPFSRACEWNREEWNREEFLRRTAKNHEEFLFRGSNRVLRPSRGSRSLALAAQLEAYMRHGILPSVGGAESRFCPRFIRTTRGTYRPRKHGGPGARPVHPCAPSRCSSCWSGRARRPAEVPRRPCVVWRCM